MSDGILHIRLFADRLRHRDRQLRILLLSLHDQCRQIAPHMPALPQEHRHHANYADTGGNQLLQQLRQIRLHQFKKSQPDQQLRTLLLDQLLQGHERRRPARIAGAVSEQDKCLVRSLLPHKRGF